MINGKTVLAVIPARGGSKGIPGKNIRILAGKPLINWTIEEAKKSLYIDRLILSSDSQEIIKVARNAGCEAPFVRPAELARDDTPGVDPVIHAILALPEQYSYVVLLQPTSPLRTTADIDNCIEKCALDVAPVCVSVCESEESPYWMYFLDDQGKMRNIMQNDNGYYRRQNLPQTFRLNGAVYVAATEYLLANRSFLGDETKAYIMPYKRSIDIDEEKDFVYCEFVIKEWSGGN